MCLEDFISPVIGSFLHEDRKLDTCALTKLALLLCSLHTCPGQIKFPSLSLIWQDKSVSKS